MLHEQVEALAAAAADLELDVNALDAHLEGERERLRAFVDSVSAALDEPAGLRLAPTPRAARHAHPDRRPARPARAAAQPASPRRAGADEPSVADAEAGLPSPPTPTPTPRPRSTTDPSPPSDDVRRAIDEAPRRSTSTEGDDPSAEPADEAPATIYLDSADATTHRHDLFGHGEPDEPDEPSPPPTR